MGRSAEFSQGATKPPHVRSTRVSQNYDEVTLDNVSDNHVDADLAKHAGMTKDHMGFGVQRWPDSNSATVRLWKD